MPFCGPLGDGGHDGRIVGHLQVHRNLVDVGVLSGPVARRGRGVQDVIIHAQDEIDVAGHDGRVVGTDECRRDRLLERRWIDEARRPAALCQVAVEGREDADVAVRLLGIDGLQVDRLVEGAVRGIGLLIARERRERYEGDGESHREEREKRSSHIFPFSSLLKSVAD